MGIRDLLKITNEDAHLITAGLELNRKATLLRNLLRRSDHPQKSKAIGALNKIQNDSKRNILVHSYLGGTPTTINFIERSKGGAVFHAKNHKFTFEEFQRHVDQFVEQGANLQLALDFRTVIATTSAMLRLR